MARTVTAAQLVRLGACREQVALFRATFGKSVVVTRDAAIAHADKFSWDWAAAHLLTPAQRAAYDAARASALAAYDAARASARAAYRAARASAGAAYDAALASALAAYDAAVASARAAYRAAVAAAFADAFNS